MIKLINAELKKIFRKKSFLIVTIIFILYCILTNVIYKEMDTLLEMDDLSINELENINNSLNLNDKEDLEEYITNKTDIEISKLKDKYKSMEIIIDKYLYNLIYERNNIKYNTLDEEELNNINNNIDNIMSYIKSNNWQYFTKLEKEEIEEKLKENKDDERLNELLKLKEYRLKNNINYDYNNYLNNAIDTIETDLLEYYNLKNKEVLTKDEEERFTSLKEEMAINNYIIDHKVDANNSNTLRAVLTNFPNEFGLFILIYVVMISGSIVSEEFNKGTIKYLLTKPHKRSTILTAKLLTIIILIPFIIIFMSLIEIIIGSLILGIKSLSVPVLIYESSTGILKSYHVLKYLALLLISTLPEYLILALVCFLLSTITTSTSAAITITFLFYLISNVISNLALLYNIKIFKYFIALHWNFNYLVNKTSNPYNFKPIFSLGIISIYIIIILCISYIYFNKKDVKNI